MEDYLAAANVLWPGGGKADSVRRAAAHKCNELGLQVECLGQGTCKVLDLMFLVTTMCERTLLRSAVEEAGARFAKVSTAAKLILPAAIFTVGPFQRIPGAIRLDLHALKAAAAEVCHALPEASVLYAGHGLTSSVWCRRCSGRQCQLILAAL